MKTPIRWMKEWNAISVIPALGTFVLSFIWYLTGSMIAEAQNLDFPNLKVLSLALQSDQKTVIGGSFTEVGDRTIGRIARLNRNGSLDETFEPGEGANGIVSAIAVQADGKILIGGDFTMFAGVPRNRFARLNRDGSLDTEFDPPGGVNSRVNDILIQSDGGILIGGAFTQAGGRAQSYLARFRSDGELDSDYVPSINNTVYALESGANGEVLMGGDFTVVNGEVRNRIARLNRDGTLDETFDPAAGPNGSVFGVALQDDGKVYIGGAFSVVGGQGYKSLARLNENGLLDPTYFSTVNSTVHALALQPDNKVLAGGVFTLVDGQTLNRLVRLQPDGVVDSSFEIGEGANARISALALQPDGSVVLGGDFTEFDGESRNYVTVVPGLNPAAGGEIEFASFRYSVSEGQTSVSISARRSGNTGSGVTVEYETSNGTANAGDYTLQSGTLSFDVGETEKSFNIPLRPDTDLEDDETVNLTLSNPTGGAVLGGQHRAVLWIENDDTAIGVGTVDAGFAGDVSGGIVYSVAVQPDGKIVVGGDFQVAGGVSRHRLARFNSNGTIDESFKASTWVNNTVHAIAIQSDGRILIGGGFTSVNGIARNRIARLRADGSLDKTFDPPGGANGVVYDFALELDGDILVVGAFSQFNGESRGYLVRLFNDGNIEPGFVGEANGVVHALELESDGGMFIGGNYTIVNGQTRNRIARLHANGTLDEGFDPVDGPNRTVYDLVSQSDGKIIVGGTFTSIGGQSKSYLSRLNANGLVDTAYAGVLNGAVHALRFQPDGRLLAGGGFTIVNDVSSNRLTRLQSNGEIDPTFEMGEGPNAIVRSLSIQPDGNIMVGGDFKEFSGLNRNYVTRVQGLSVAGGGEIEFAMARYQVIEDQLSAVINLHRSGNTGNVVTIDYETSNGTANAGDYTSRSGTLVFEAGEKEKTFTIPLRADTSLEDDESVNLTLSNPSGGAVLGARRSAVLWIENDDSVIGIGSVDAGFSSGATSGIVYSVAAQADGKVVVGGGFLVAGGLSRQRVARFNSNGSIDESFNPNASVSGTVHAIAIQSDGRILIGGNFLKVNGEARGYLARLRADGTLDSSFNPPGGANGVVYDLALEPDGDIVVSGSFTMFNGENRGYIVRLFSDGNIDSEFQASVNRTVYALAVEADGSVLIGGDFTTVNGETRNRIARLNADGTIVEAFDPAEGPNTTVFDLAALPDGKVYIGGSFSKVGGQQTFTYLARLNADGLADHTFHPSLNNTVSSLALQPDSKLLAGGSFTTVNGETTNRLMRLLPNGLLDPSFQIGEGADNIVRSVSLQRDGNILIGGDFTQYAGLSRQHVAKIQGLSVSTGGEIEFASLEYRVSESQPSVSIQVKRSGNTSRAVTVDYETSNGTANAGDYSLQSSTLVFGEGEKDATFNIPLRSDTKLEDDESVDLTLFNPTGGAVLGAQRDAVLWIENDDAGVGIGSIEARFAREGVGGIVYSVAAQADGKIVIGGDFLDVGGVSRQRVARLDGDGTIDEEFNPNAWVSGSINAILIQSDGRILLGGNFTMVNGVARNYVARLRADGTLDKTFNPPGGANGVVHALALEPDDDILVGGAFTQFNGESRLRLVRLFSDGNIEPEFSASANQTINALVLESDGTLLIGGAFTQVNGVGRQRMARLNPDGTLEETFDTGEGFNSTVNEMAVQANGGILVGGAFTQVNGQAVKYLTRLGRTGELDPNFEASLNGAIHTVSIETDGKVLIGGDFTTVGEMMINRLARLESQGALDETFDVGEGADGTVRAIAMQSEGRVVIGGSFMKFDELNRPHLVMIQTLEPTTQETAEPLIFEFIGHDGGNMILTAIVTPQASYELQQSQDLKVWDPVGLFSSDTAVLEITLPINAESAIGVFRAVSQ